LNILGDLSKKESTQNSKKKSQRQARVAGIEESWNHIPASQQITFKTEKKKK